MSYGRTSTSVLVKTLDLGPFWPTLELAAFQRDYKFPSDYATDTVITTTARAASEVISELKVTKADWQAAGYDTLADVPQESLLDMPELVGVFTHAVFSLAKAKLYAQLESMTRKATSESLSNEAEKNQAYWITESRKAVKRLQGKPTLTAELM